MKDFYSENYELYHERTFSIDPSPFLEPFIKILPKGACILDIGCGSGRDLLWLKERGFKVAGFERSTGLAKLARKNSSCEVIEGDFETFDFSPLSFDAVIASGSLVHIPHDKFITIFQNITKCMSAAIVYLSLKEGTGQQRDHEGRTFYLWSDEKLRKLFSEAQFEVINFSRSKSAVNSNDIWLGYVLKESVKEQKSKHLGDN
jgi:SAM-dependent methyltransferase